MSAEREIFLLSEEVEDLKAQLAEQAERVSQLENQLWEAREGWRLEELKNERLEKARQVCPGCDSDDGRHYSMQCPEAIAQAVQACPGCYSDEESHRDECEENPYVKLEAEAASSTSHVVDGDECPKGECYASAYFEGSAEWEERAKTAEAALKDAQSELEKAAHILADGLSDPKHCNADVMGHLCHHCKAIEWNERFDATTSNADELTQEKLNEENQRYLASQTPQDRYARAEEFLDATDERKSQLIQEETDARNGVHAGCGGRLYGDGVDGKQVCEQCAQLVSVVCAPTPGRIEECQECRLHYDCCGQPCGKNHNHPVAAPTAKAKEDTE